MGLHAAVLTWLKKALPAAFNLGGDPNFADSVFIHDVLTYLRRLRGPSPDGSFTGSELFRLVSVPVFTRFSQRMCIEVISCDIACYMPHGFKHKEQASRDESKKKANPNATPYPDNVEICTEGIRLAGEDRPCARFDIHRVLSSRKVARETLMRFLDYQFRYQLLSLSLCVADYLCRWQKHRIPHGCAIVMDYSSDGPVLITNDYAGPMVLRGGYVTQLDTKPRILRQHGEADHAMPFWLHTFRERTNKIVCTIDRDVLMHVLAYITTSVQPVKGRITWVYTDIPTGKFMQVDMMMLARKVLANEFNLRRLSWQPKVEPGCVNTTLMQFLMVCILLGTDFLDKSEITPRVGDDKILTAVNSCSAEIKKLRVPLGTMRVDEAKHTREENSLYFPFSDCDWFYVCDQPAHPGQFAQVMLAHLPFPPALHTIIYGYLVPPAVDMAEVKLTLRTLDVAIGGKSNALGCLEKIMRILHYVLLNWNDQNFEDPVQRYFRKRVQASSSNSSSKRVRDEDREQDPSDRPLKIAKFFS